MFLSVNNVLILGAFGVSSESESSSEDEFCILESDFILFLNSCLFDSVVLILLND